MWNRHSLNDFNQTLPLWKHKENSLPCDKWFMTQSKNRGGRRKVLETHRDEMMRAALNILSLAAWLCVWFLSVLSCIDDWLPWFWCSRDCLFTFKCGRSVLQVVFQRLSDCAFRCLVSASRAQCTEHLVFSSRLCHWGYSASSLSDFQGLIYSSSPRFCDHSLIRELKGCLLSILALICDPDVSVQRAGGSHQFRVRKRGLPLT